MLAHIHGNVLNMGMLARSLEITAPTIKKYIHFLSEAFLIRILEPYHFNIKKRLVKSPKIYVRDSGVLHAILGIPSPAGLEGNPIIGASWEGYIIEQIYQQCRDDFDMYFYRTHHGAECDLVLAKANHPIAAVEIKYTAAPRVTKGLKISIEDLNTSNNFIVCATDMDYPIAENIIVCNVLSFLQNHLPNLG